MRFILFCIFLTFTTSSFAQSLADLRGQAFRKSASCNIIQAKEIFELSATPFTEKEVPEVRTMIQDVKELREECYEQAEEIISNLLIDEQNMANHENALFILKLQYEADQSFQELLRLRKHASQELLESILSDIEKYFLAPVEKAQFYEESAKTQHLIQLETSLALESERRQIFVEEQREKPNKTQQLNTILQKSHYQLTKTLLLFENWPINGSNHAFFKKLNADLRYSVSILSQVLPLKDSLSEEEYKIFRDMLQKAVRLNLKVSDEANWAEAKSSEIYAEISSFTEIIRSLL